MSSNLRALAGLGEPRSGRAATEVLGSAPLRGAGLACGLWVAVAMHCTQQGSRRSWAAWCWAHVAMTLSPSPPLILHPCACAQASSRSWAAWWWPIRFCQGYASGATSSNGTLPPMPCRQAQGSGQHGAGQVWAVGGQLQGRKRPRHWLLLHQVSAIVVTAANARSQLPPGASVSWNIPAVGVRMEPPRQAAGARAALLALLSLPSAAHWPSARAMRLHAIGFVQLAI